METLTKELFKNHQEQTESLLEMEGLTPAEYFDFVKSSKHTCTDEFLTSMYNNCLVLLNKYKITGQVSAARKVLFQMNCIEKEREIISLGVNTFIYREDIESYIDDVAKNVIKIIELDHYEREIPDDIVKILKMIKPYFTQFYVVYTDYTGKDEQRIEKERREKDPILFGTFQDKAHRSLSDRFYYIGDWVDEYCDLTLDKLISEMDASNHPDILHTICTPEDIKEFEKELLRLENGENGRIYIVDKPEKRNSSVFSKVKSFLTRKDLS